MKTIYTTLILIFAALSTACIDDDETNTTNFTVFTKDLLSNTADNIDPVEIDAKIFVFQDKENPQAYDDVI